MGEYEAEATIVGKVKCPNCGEEFEVELTDTVVVDIEPEHYGEPD